MGRLRDWWVRLTGQAVAPTEPPQQPRPRAAPGDDGLKLADDLPKPRPSRTAAAGFDPYSSDAGYAKPHSWERVDHD
jgi:hypothetical protein